MVSTNHLSRARYTEERTRARIEYAYIDHDAWATFVIHSYFDLLPARPW